MPEDTHFYCRGCRRLVGATTLTTDGARTCTLCGGPVLATTPAQTLVVGLPLPGKREAA